MHSPKIIIKLDKQTENDTLKNPYFIGSKKSPDSQPKSLIALCVLCTYGINIYLLAKPFIVIILNYLFL